MVGVFELICESPVKDRFQHPSPCYYHHTAFSTFFVADGLDDSSLHLITPYNIVALLQQIYRVVGHRCINFEVPCSVVFRYPYDARSVVDNAYQLQRTVSDFEYIYHRTAPLYILLLVKHSKAKVRQAVMS